MVKISSLCSCYMLQDVVSFLFVVNFIFYYLFTFYFLVNFPNARVPGTLAQYIKGEK